MALAQRLAATAFKAVLAGVIPKDRRGTAFGVYDTAYGIAWFAGSATMGVLHDVSLLALVAFSVATQFAALNTATGEVYDKKGRKNAKAKVSPRRGGDRGNELHRPTAYGMKGIGVFLYLRNRVC